MANKFHGLPIIHIVGKKSSVQEGHLSDGKYIFLDRATLCMQISSIHAPPLEVSISLMGLSKLYKYDDGQRQLYQSTFSSIVGIRTMAQNGVRLKLLIDTKGQRVLFAEADKKVVDFLFHLLSLPLGTTCKILQEKGMVGCLENLYKSVETLDQTYFQPDGQKRESLLKPKVVSFCSSTMLLPYTNPPTLPKIYVCDNTIYNYNTQCRYNFSDDPNAVCPKCCKLMRQQLTYVEPPIGSTNPTTIRSTEKEGGYVKGVVSYMVMDDLRVMPMSTISCVTLWNKFKIKEVDALEEKLITLNVDEGVKLLRASLQSKTVLTDVFLVEKE